MKKIKIVSIAIAMLLSVVAYCGTLRANAQEPVATITQTRATDSSVRISWTGNMSKYYGVEVSTDPSFATVNKQEYTTLTEMYLSGLPAGSKIYVRVGSGSTYKTCYADFSQPFEVVTAPSKPLSLKFVGATDSTAKLAWDAVAGATSYIVKNGDLQYAASGTSYDMPFGQGAASYAYVYAVNSSQSGFNAVSDASPLVSNLSNLSMNIDKDNFGISNAYTSINSYYFAANCYGHGYDLEGVSTKGGKKFSGVSTSVRSEIHMTSIARNYMYKYRVRAYVTTTDGQKVYGNWSPYRYICCPKSMKYSRSGAGIQMKWNKLNGVSRIIIKTSTKEKTGYKTVAKLKGTAKGYTAKKCGKKNMKKGKTYYVHVEYQYKSGKKYYTSDVYSRTDSVYLYK